MPPPRRRSRGGRRSRAGRGRCRRTPGASGTRSSHRSAEAELREEAQVVVEEESDVVDLVLEDGDALDAHPEGPARHLLGIVADVAQDVRVNHARAEDLDPSPVLAEATAAAAALEAQDVRLRGRLREREERRAEAQSRPWPEHLT